MVKALLTRHETLYKYEYGDRATTEPKGWSARNLNPM
jgi:hypothetical protein